MAFYTHSGLFKMKMISLIVMLFLSCSTSIYANEFSDKTSACRMEVKILGPDMLDEDENCLWVQDNLTQVIEKCKNCLNDLELIKEASQGNFDY